MKFEVTSAPTEIKKYLPKINKVFDKYFDNMLQKNWISINFVTSDKVKELNSKYKKLNQTTDVLSFPFTFADSPTLEEDEELGEVYISEEVVKKNAQEYLVDYHEELLRVFIHGALHILGYEHKGTLDSPEKGDEDMFDMQEAMIKEVLK